jgi:osmotically-inducible protein OsmY
MKFYRKWILTLGIAAVTPGIAMAGPLTFWKKSDQKPASKATAQSNQKLAEKVAGQLRSARLSGFDIEIEVKNGVCLLKGKIANAGQKQQASQLASAVAGVNRVDNRLSVLDQGAAKSAPTIQQTGATQAPSRVQQAVAQESPSAKRGVKLTGLFKRKGPSDQAVANTVAKAIGQSGLRGHDMNLKVKNGVAYISGKVRSPGDVAIVTQVVSRVPGIRQVDNKLQAPGQQSAIQQTAGRQPGVPAVGDNQGMAEMIAGAIGRSPLANEDIEVRFNGGIATLSGAVGHPEMAQMAELIAGAGPGVQGVKNNLRVVPGAGARPGAPAQFNPALGGRPQFGQAGQPGGPQFGGPGGPQFGQPGRPQYGQPGGRPPIQQVAMQQGYGQGPGGGMIPPMPAPAQRAQGQGASHMAYDNPQLPDYAWPSYASYPNYAALSYPTEYSASAWPYIGPFYPYPQVPLGWRQVQMEWDDGYWNLNFRPRTDKWFWYLDPKNW